MMADIEQERKRGSSSDSQYTRQGLTMWLNNMPEQAEQHFKEMLDRTPVFAGYVLVLSLVFFAFLYI